MCGDRYPHTDRAHPTTPMKNLISRVIEWRPLRYLLSGGTAAAANLTVLFVLVHFFHIWYLEASVLSFIIGMCVSFVLQKFFTFSDFSRQQMRWQTSLHIGIQLVSHLICCREKSLKVKN